jgi:hypothetical protein
MIALTMEGERRQDVLRQLEMKVVQVEAEHDRWVRRHEAAADANQRYINIYIYIDTYIYVYLYIYISVNRHKQSITIKEKEDTERMKRDQEDLTAQRLVNLTTVDDIAEKRVDMVERANQDQSVILQRAELEMVYMYIYIYIYI